MMDADIEKIRKILRYRGKTDLAELLKYSISKLDISSTYGSVWFSVLSAFEIYSPIEDHERLKNISEDDQKAIFEAVLEIYPLKEYSPEITNIEFYVDPDLEPKDNTVVCNELREVDFEYIKEQIEKCEDKIEKHDYDGAITNARTLVESTCLFIKGESEVSYKFSGDLTKLYKEVSKLLEMDPALYQEDCFKQILSGITSIINGLSSLRNKMSDAHGKQKAKYYKPSERHAIFAVNVAKAISEFIYSSWKSKNK
jgi:hypothetical protein